MSQFDRPTVVSAEHLFGSAHIFVEMDVRSGEIRLAVMKFGECPQWAANDVENTINPNWLEVSSELKAGFV